MSELEAARQLKSDYQPVLSKQAQRIYKELELQKVQLIDQIEKSTPELNIEEDGSVQQQLNLQQEEQLRSEILPELESDLSVLSGKLITLLNERQTYLINDEQLFLELQPSEQVLNFQDKKTEQGFSAVWQLEDEAWIVQDCDLVYERAMEISQQVTRNLEIISQSNLEQQKQNQKQKELQKQSDLELDL